MKGYSQQHQPVPEGSMKMKFFLGCSILFVLGSIAAYIRLDLTFREGFGFSPEGSPTRAERVRNQQVVTSKLSALDAEITLLSALNEKSGAVDGSDLDLKVKELSHELRRYRSAADFYQYDDAIYACGDRSTPDAGKCADGTVAIFVDR